MFFDSIQFAYPWVLALLLVVPLLGFWYYKKSTEYYPDVKFSSTGGFGGPQSWRVRFKWLVQAAQLLAISFLIVALARPQTVLQQENITAEGIDIMLAMDVSTSMLAKDFEPDRLEASKEVAQNFVSQRKTDRMGLVVFAGESFTQCPITSDLSIVKQFLSKLEAGLIENGTAIGMGLSNAVKRLKDSEAKSKVIILLTDGVNNAGFASPMQAADAAKKLGIRVYTIGVGSKGQAKTPVAQRPNGSYVYGWQMVDIDENLLQEISKETGGQYFRAKDIEELKAIYQEIDRLEKTKIETTTIKRYSEAFHSWIWLAILFVLIKILLANLVFKSIV
jgi:Ca-activated chloride channel family protein